MTQRERDILKASVSWTDKTLTVKEEKAFQAGAEWADKTMIEKACDWLNQNVEKYESVTKMGYMPFSLIEDMINDFRKAMEG